MEPQQIAATEKGEPAVCHCPFCDNTVEMPFPFCQVCGSQIVYCQVCGQPLPQEAETCPHCAEEQ